MEATEKTTGSADTIFDGKRTPEASSLLAAIVDSSDDAIISKDLNGIIMSWNKSAERLFGYTASEAVGQSILLIIPPERADEEPKILERLKRGERVDHFETVRVHKNGSRLNISLTISPVKDASGQIVGASKIARDITARVRQEKALREANEALKRANADLEQFAYSAAHDLQEPLRMVATYSELLQKRFGGRLGPKCDEYIAFTVEGAVRMENLLKDLRIYTQLSTAENENVAEVDANDILQRALLNLKVAIKESGASVTSTELPRVCIYEFQLQQVFQNLIGNAIRYRSSEPPSIHVTARREGSEWVFSIRDNGIGIDPKFREHIFGIFKRLHSASEYPGTGMGLAICKRIIERGGGRIWVESTPGRGSTFYFTVGCREPAERRSGPEEIFDSSGGGQSGRRRVGA
jgi:PAS domain S-box-containing protein